MNDFYKIKIAGLERELPLCKINDSLSIAAFVIFGDVEMTVASASALLKKCPDFDVILAPEAKSIPLAYEMARQSGKPYIIARKAPKLYMKDAVSAELRSITTYSIQTLYIDAVEGERLRCKNVLIVDDVISTGESLKAVEALTLKLGGVIAGKAAILAEGDAADRDDIIYLEPLPLFKR